MNVIEKTIRALTNSPMIYDFVQTVLEGDYHETITDAVGQTEGESILEIGCGTGYFAQFFGDDYTGVDIDPHYIAAAQRQRSSRTKTFRVGDATALDIPDKSFDKTVIINVIHHLSDDEVKTVLKEAKRIARKHIYIFDMTTDNYSLITPLLLRLDNGKYIRPLVDQLALVRKELIVERSFAFPSPRKILGHSVIVCSV